MLYKTLGLWSEEHNLDTWAWWHHRRGPRLYVEEEPYSFPASGRAALPFEKRLMQHVKNTCTLLGVAITHACRTRGFCCSNVDDSKDQQNDPATHGHLEVPAYVGSLTGTEHAWGESHGGHGSLLQQVGTGSVAIAHFTLCPATWINKRYFTTARAKPSLGL